MLPKRKEPDRVYKVVRYIAREGYYAVFVEEMIRFVAVPLQIDVEIEMGWEGKEGEKGSQRSGLAKNDGKG